MKSAFYLIVFILMVFFSCKKYEVGDKGDKGTPGGAGNLVVKDLSLTMDSTSWTKAEFVWINEIFTDLLTQNVLEKGEVKVYQKIDGNWFVLPHGENYIFTQASFELGKIKLLNEHIHGGVPPRPATTNYRIVFMSPAN